VKGFHFRRIIQPNYQPGFTFDYFQDVTTDAIPSAPVADDEPSYPVLISLAFSLLVLLMLFISACAPQGGTPPPATNSNPVKGGTWIDDLYKRLCCKKDDAMVSSASIQEAQRSIFHEPAEPVQMASL